MKQTTLLKVLVLLAAPLLLPGVTVSGASLSPLDQVDLRPAFHRLGLLPKNQGHRDTCSLFAITALAEFELSLVNPSNASPLSPEYLVWAANEATGLDRDSAMFYEALCGLRKFGLCMDRLYPYSLEPGPVASPSREAIKDGKTRTQWKERWIKRWDVNGGLDQDQVAMTKQELASGHPVAVGLRWPKDPKMSKDLVFNTPPNEEVFDGHSVLFVGYRNEPDLPGGGVFIFRNSAGTAWGEKGHAHLSYEYVMKYANSAVGLRASSPSNPRKLPLILEAEELRVIATEKGEAMLQSMAPWGKGLWGNGSELFFRSEKEGSVELEFKVKRPGRFRIELDATCGPDFGKLQTWINGKKLGEVIDLYGGRVYPYRDLDLGVAKLKSGRNRVRFSSVGKGPRSSNFFLGIDAMRLIPEK